MRVLYAGDLHQYGNTSGLRLHAMQKVADEVDAVNLVENPLSLKYKIAYHMFLKGAPVNLPDNCHENAKLLNAVRDKKYDVIWVDKGITIRPQTLQDIRRACPDTILINYSPDNMIKCHCQSNQYLKCIPLYDAHVTTKSYILEEFYGLGARKICFVNQTFEPDFHYPRDISEADYRNLGSEAGFIGAWEQQRMESILYLSRNGIRVRVFGSREWERCKGDNPNLTIEDRGLYGDDYCRAFRCFRISLCFLRKINGDLQTSRSVEIPACGGFMLAERTAEHQSLFEEGKEAEFFGSNEELLNKCRYYLSDEEERRKIADRGRERCLRSDYTNETMIRNVLEQTCR